jgi:ribonuclease III
LAARKKAPTGLAALEERLGHRFARPELLELALTHRSHTYEARGGVVTGPVYSYEGREQRNQPGSDNEQLEFLGDAVLGFAVTEALFREFPHCGEGELTRLRASLVSRQRMAAVGEELGLGEHLRLGRSAEANGSRQKPALLANAAEAVLAAAYLDAGGASGKGVRTVATLVDRLLLQPELPALREAMNPQTGASLRDAKTLLQERVQAEAIGRLRYIDTAQSGPPHQRTFAVEVRLEDLKGEQRVLAAAEGASKKEAQQRAAEIALAAWSRAGASA